MLIRYSIEYQVLFAVASVRALAILICCATFRLFRKLSTWVVKLWGAHMRILTLMDTLKLPPIVIKLHVLDWRACSFVFDWSFLYLNPALPFHLWCYCLRVFTSFHNTFILVVGFSGFWFGDKLHRWQLVLPLFSIELLLGYMFNPAMYAICQCMLLYAEQNMHASVCQVFTA